MAKRNMQMTGLGRFIIFMLIVAPLIYLGASYYTGQDGLQKLKNLFNYEESNQHIVTEADTNPQDAEVQLNSELARLKDELSTKEQKNKQLYLENEQLKKELLEVKEELSEVKGQLEKIKNAIN